MSVLGSSTSRELNAAAKKMFRVADLADLLPLAFSLRG
jgi:hypothetical protein